ncbi:enhanced serine sensitivity protein SseB C-terminal domain-containing protein [Kangiella sp. M94]
MEFVPENELELSLVKAATDAAHRPQFYKDLCNADLFIIQHGEKPPESHERVTLTEGKAIQIQNIEHNGKPYIPVFSSVNRLQQVIETEVAYLGVNALELMKLTQGAELLLNPGSDYGKEFTKSEIESIIDGSIWGPPETHTQKTSAEVMLGQPKVYPQELTSALSRFFKTKKQVNKAWVAHFHNPDDGLPPHTLIAVDAGEFYKEIIGEIGMIINSITIPNPPVDIIPITNGSGLEQYFLNGQKPFYKRKVFGLF